MRALVLPAEWTLFDTSEHLSVQTSISGSFLNVLNPGQYCITLSFIRYLCDSTAHLV
jgi:hypothetical protein